MTPDALATLLDSLAPEGLAVDKQPTGYTASIFYGLADWSPREFASTASEAIEKVLRLHGRQEVAPVLAPPSKSDVPTLAPPPY